MQTLDQLFDDYTRYHQTAGNKWCHRAGIPMIVFSLLGLLSRVVLWRADWSRIDLGILLIAAAGIYYLLLEWRLGSLMIVATALLYAAALFAPLSLLIALFVLGWILQFIGHGVYEKKNPAFLQNLVHLLIGPLWILNDLIPVARRR